MAVGYSGTPVNASEFPGFSNLLMCPQISYQPVAVGVIGMRVAYVEFPNPMR
jgi:hypothetical protein